jgi:hypothetical protein
MMGSLLVHIACLLSAAQSACAWQLHPQIKPITAAARQYSPRSTTTALKAGQQSQLLEFFQQKDKDNFSSVEDFDQDLADEIQEALLSAGSDGIIGSTAESPSNGQPTISAAVSESSSSDTTQINSSEKQIICPPIQTKSPKLDATPPHTNLAQVMANQLNIDLSFVTPSNPGAKKITASDVEYHAWKMSQPPSTPEALARAHQLELDLNTLYDDEDREYVMQLSDVQLYEENIRSLRVVSQKRRGVVTNANSKTRQRMKKLSALDERMEKRMEFLVKKLGNVAGGIAKRVQTSSDFNVILGDIKKKKKKKKDAPEIKTVEDFDAALAIEIQEALLCADDSNNENNCHQIGSTNSSQSITGFSPGAIAFHRDMIIDDVDSDAEDQDLNADAEPRPEIKSEQDFDAALAIEIGPDSNNESNGHTQNIVSGKLPQSINDVDIDADADDDLETIQPINDVDAAAEDELETIHTSMTVAEIREQLQTHGVKVSGNKSELVKRLCILKQLQSMTVEQLKQELRNQDLKVSGKKAELVERLLDVEGNEMDADRSPFFVNMQ